jgi:hypothetical protein
MDSRLSGRIGSGDQARVAPRVARHRRIRAVTALAFLVPYVTGCFNYVLTDAPLAPGSQVAVELTERGRTEMLEVLGPGVERIEGRVLANSDDDLVLAVASTQHVGLREPVRWSGERVELPMELVSTVRERTLDRTRSLVAGGLALAVIVAATLIGFDVGGQEDGRSDQPDRNGEVEQ